MNTKTDVLTLKARLKRGLKSGWRDYWRPWTWPFELLRKLFRLVVH
jgi:hypothetical protein